MVSEIAKRLGIKQALGNSKQAELAMFLVAGRIISQGSRNYLANEWIKGEAVEQIFKPDNFTEDTLYDNLDRLSENQQEIERRIYRYRCRNKPVKSCFYMM